MVGAPMKILAVDPGKFHMGVAFFEGDCLKGAKLYKIKDPHDLVFIASSIQQEFRNDGPITYVSEIPMIYPAVRSKGDPNDLIPLALNTGILAGALAPTKIIFYKPYEWKGTIDGDMMLRRIESKLRPAERLLLPEKINHNVLDAIGVGFKYTKRML